MLPPGEPLAHPPTSSVELFGFSDGYIPDMTYSEAVTFCVSKGFDCLCSASEYDQVADYTNSVCMAALWAPIYD
jgi:hypothetical protein